MSSVPKSGYVAYSSLDMVDIAARTRDAFVQLHSGIPFDILPMKWGVWPDGTEVRLYLLVFETERLKISDLKNLISFIKSECY